MRAYVFATGKAIQKWEQFFQERAWEEGYRQLYGGNNVLKNGGNVLFFNFFSLGAFYRLF